MIFLILAQGLYFRITTYDTILWVKAGWVDRKKIVLLRRFYAMAVQFQKKTSLKGLSKQHTMLYFWFNTVKLDNFYITEVAELTNFVGVRIAASN